MNTLITGASGNLGKATISKFLKEGHRVIALTGKRGLDSNPGSGLVTYEADLVNESAAGAVVNQVITSQGKIDAALLLVGGFAAGNIDATETEAIRKMLALNFETAYNVARPVFRHMVATGGGRIVFIASKTSLVDEAGKNFIAYALSKSLVTRLAELLNAEGASSNVVCSVVAPSIIDTPDNRKAMPNADYRKWVTPESIADAMHFLVSSPGQALRQPVLKMYGQS